MNKKEKIILILLLLAFGGASALLLLHADIPASTRNGALDLSQWDGERILYLSGSWDFYWNRFLDESDLRQNPAPDLEAEVPAVWNKFVVGGKQLGGMGYATYRLHVTGAEVGTPLALRIPPLSTAYEMYVGDDRIASSGQVSTSADGFTPQYRVQTATFTPGSREFDLILHVSNFVYARGGAWYGIYFGSSEKINALSEMIFGRDFFILGCLLLISAYCLFLLCLRREKGYLLFLVLCVFILGRTIINGNYIINLLIPSLKFRTGILLDYITLYWLPCLCLWLFRYIYPKNISRRLVQLLFLYAAGITLITLAVPIRIFTKFIYTAELIAAAVGVYGMIKMIVLAVRREPEAFYLFVGGTELTFCVLHDVLCENDLIHMGYVEYSPVGFLILAILLQCLFWVQYDRRSRENIRMRFALGEADRRQRKLELQFLKSQIRPHFVNNALNAIISVSRTDGVKARKLLVEFSRYLHNCYSVKDLDDKVPIGHELSFVRAYVALEQARYPDSLYVAYEIDDVFLMVPPLTLQPLVENAIIHGIREKPGDGHIRIYVKDRGEFTQIGVLDDGVGISKEAAAALLSSNYQGTGVGICNINRRMQRLYNTGLHLDSRPDGGTDAYILVPKEGEVCCEPY